MATPAKFLTRSTRNHLTTTLMLLAGLAALTIPTLLSLLDQSWSKEAGEQGPIVLATGGWLFWRRLPYLRQNAQSGRPWITFCMLAISLLLYVAGRTLDFITLEAGGLYGVGLTLFHDRFGLTAMRRMGFPLLYLGFAVPPPTVLIDSITSPLKHFVTWVATSGLQSFGLPVAHQGVTIFISQYQLLVEDACSGMNSLIGLTAISLLYIYLLKRSSPLYTVILISFVVPIAIISNIIRIVTLILITYWFGDEVAQGFLHFTAGLFLFAAALAMVFGLDTMLSRLSPRAGAKT